MNKVVVSKIENVVRVEEESEDIFDLIAENTTDKLVDRSGITQKLFKRDAAQTRKALKHTIERLKPHFLP